MNPFFKTITLFISSGIITANAQQLGDFTQVNTNEFTENPVVGQLPDYDVKWFSTEFTGSWTNFQRENGAGFTASTDIAQLSLQQDTLLAARPGLVRSALALGESVFDVQDGQLADGTIVDNGDMFDSSFWCIGRLDTDPNVAESGEVTFTLPTGNVGPNEELEWAVWLSPDTSYSGAITATGDWGTTQIVTGNSVFMWEDAVQNVFQGETLTINTEEISGVSKLSEGNMATLWIGARVVPEPSSLMMLVLGAAGFLIRRRS